MIAGEAEKLIWRVSKMKPKCPNVQISRLCRGYIHWLWEGIGLVTSQVTEIRYVTPKPQALNFDTKIEYVT